MSKIVPALSKLMIGLAWADRKINREEMELLKDITFRLPEITADDWFELDIYWMTPITDVELNRLAEDFFRLLNAPANVQAVKGVLASLIAADGQITPHESHLIREINKELDAGSPTILPDLSRLLAEALPKRGSQLLGKAGEFEQKRVSARLKQQYGANIADRMGLHEDELIKLSVAGSLMGRVAYADQQIDGDEIQLMHQILQREWSLQAQHAEVVVNYAVDAARNRLDVYRLAREFVEQTTYQERLAFLELLFDLAAVHDGIFIEELDEIELIARALKIHYEDFKAIRQSAMNREQRYPMTNLN